ncbi:hypothetical protein [Thiocapsa marina]|uniref:Uncharacterized protein n=1 Tax=Thiocapsa marina 5811 TaxID=768671 RepID=F9UII9_9GAMM|nr:hypothetical protein [Thiocapsa marina]EGV15971.1 hypothetical protein ThimaDRAFT_4742 [Thiocapsa marina 5811]
MLPYAEVPLSVCFLAMYLLTPQNIAVSARGLKRHLGVFYPTV